MEMIYPRGLQGEMSDSTRNALLALVATKFSALSDITLGDEEVWFQVDRTSNPGQMWKHSDGIGIDMGDRFEIRIVGTNVKKYNSYEPKLAPPLINLAYQLAKDIPQARYVLQEIHQRFIALLNKFYEAKPAEVNEESLSNVSNHLTEQLIYDFSASLRKGHLTEARIKEEFDDNNIIHLKGSFNLNDVFIRYGQYKDLIQFHIIFNSLGHNSVTIKIPLEDSNKIVFSSSEIFCLKSFNSSAVSDPEQKSKILRELAYFLKVATTQREEQLAWEKSIFDLREVLKDSLQRAELSHVGSKRSPRL